MSEHQTTPSENRPVSLDIIQHYTILVVDDDESLQIYMKKMLEGEYEVLQAVTVGEALRHLESGNVDLVLLDLMLPGVSGISLCQTIKKRWKDLRIPVIVLTARTDLETKIEALEAGADDYITKPFHHRELMTRLKVQLRIKDLQREIIKTERLKAIIETAISANHEINNPLCAIINNSELLMGMQAVKSDEEAMGYMRNIFDNALRIEKTLKKLATMIQPAIMEYLPGIPMLDLDRSETTDIG